jgi:hypothetical protein
MRPSSSRLPAMFTTILRSALLPLLLATTLFSATACDDADKPVVIEASEIDDFVLSPAVSFGVAAEIGENLLAGFNEGDYETFARDFSPAMRAGIDEKSFSQFREQFIAEHGDFGFIYEIDLIDGVNEGVVNYLFTCHFERGDLVVRLAFPEQGMLIEGVQMGEG